MSANPHTACEQMIARGWLGRDGDWHEYSDTQIAERTGLTVDEVDEVRAALLGTVDIPEVEAAPSDDTKPSRWSILDSDDVDEVAVAEAIAGHLPARRLTRGELRETITRLVELGLNDRKIGAQLERGHSAIAKARARYGIAPTYGRRAA